MVRQFHALNHQSISLIATNTTLDSLHSANEAQAWALLLAAKSVIDSEDADQAIALQYDQSSGLVESCVGKHTQPDLALMPRGCWRYSTSLPSAAKHLLDLYLPALGTPSHRSLVTGHLGQSIDARIATVDGDAFYVTGEENRKHLHRMRALSHAVIVGVGTVQSDDPQLTTRSVTGESPVRVIIDPSARVSLDVGLLNDQAARTLLIHMQTECSKALANGPGYERILLPGFEGRVSSEDIINSLANRGLHRLFIEGGGITVSRFLEADCLHRLQIAIAPLLVGDGRPALQLPGAITMQSARRPPHKLYRMGRDVLWDFDMRDVNSVDVAMHAEFSDGKPRPPIERLL